MEDKDLGDLLDEFINFRKLRFEGDAGIENLSKVARAIGYKGHQFAYGSPLEEFLSDNPGACEAILDWIRDQNNTEWAESIESCLPEIEDNK